MIFCSHHENFIILLGSALPQVRSGSHVKENGVKRPHRRCRQVRPVEADLTVCEKSLNYDTLSPSKVVEIKLGNEHGSLKYFDYKNPREMRIFLFLECPDFDDTSVKMPTDSMSKEPEIPFDPALSVTPGTIPVFLAPGSNVPSVSFNPEFMKREEFFKFHED